VYKAGDESPQFTLLEYSNFRGYFWEFKHKAIAKSITLSGFVCTDSERLLDTVAIPLFAMEKKTFSFPELNNIEICVANAIYCANKNKQAFGNISCKIHRN
jgi:hypothetical protein